MNKEFLQKRILPVHGWTGRPFPADGERGDHSPRGTGSNGDPAHLCPVPSAPMIPRARVSTSSVRPRRTLSPRHNQSLRAYRLQVPRNSEMELATQIRNATIPPASPSSTDEIDVGTELNLVISNVVSLAGRAGSPFVFNTPE